MASKDFLRFVSDLANDSSVQQKFSQDPDGTMDAYGLDANEKKTITSKRSGAIGRLAGTHIDVEAASARW